MPPHCDSMDGPVVKAAMEALDREDVDLILPYVHEDAESELREVFDLAIKARTQGPEAQVVADRFFFENAVRIHRAGEGAAFTGLKPAGLDVGPAIPVAERSIAGGSPQPLIEFFIEELQAEIAERFGRMLKAAADGATGVKAKRHWVEQMLGLQVWSHQLYRRIKETPHEGGTITH